jgi:hypothetical protein
VRFLFARERGEKKRGGCIVSQARLDERGTRSSSIVWPNDEEAIVRTIRYFIHESGLRRGQAIGRIEGDGERERRDARAERSGGTNRDGQTRQAEREKARRIIRQSIRAHSGDSFRGGERDTANYRKEREAASERGKESWSE